MTGAVAAGTALVLASPDTAVAGGLHPSTRANALQAMHGEAFAHLAYSAYARQADRQHLARAAAVFRRTARVEFREHFTEEGRLIGFVGRDAANLRTAMSGEAKEASSMYPLFARQAREDRDFNAARLFAEIARDEAAHSRAFRRALRAITHPHSGVTVPRGPTATPHEIQPGPPRVSAARTLRNLRTAMHGEAFANAAYTLYAEHARASGRPRVARLFLRTARVERTEHFAEEATLAGLVRGTRTNLRTAIAGETMEARHMYPRFARKARAVGDLAAARLFRHIGREEAAHARAFHRVLAGLR